MSQNPSRKEKQLKHITIVGKSGSGKTTFARNYILSVAKKYNVIVYFNSQGEEVISKLSPYHAWSIDELENHIENGRRIIIYQIPLSLKEEKEDILFFQEVISFLWHIKVLNKEKELLFVIDECQDYATKQKIGYHYQLAMKRGRMWNFTLLNITQRPQDVHNTILSQTRYFYLFNLEFWDYDYMIKRLGRYENPEKFSYVLKGT